MTPEEREKFFIDECLLRLQLLDEYLQCKNLVTYSEMSDIQHDVRVVRCFLIEAVKSKPNNIDKE